MQVQIVAKGFHLTDPQRGIVERRLGFALARFGERIRRVEVLLTDVNGPRGGVDTMCKVVARIAPKGEVRAEATGIAVEEAISRAAERISRRVLTELEHRRRAKSLAGTTHAPDNEGHRD